MHCVPGVANKLQNIEKAKKEIEKLEQEATEAPSSSGVKPGRQTHAKKVALKDAGVNVTLSAEAEQAQEKDGVADATKELKDAKIEDKENEAVEVSQ